MMQKTKDFTAYDLADLADLVQILDEERDRNHIEKLCLTRSNDHANKGPMLWQVLSHPDCKITYLYVEEDAPEGPVAFGTMTAVRKWCQEVPAKNPRSLELLFRSTATTKKACDNLMMMVLDDLKKALQSPNNGVQKLVLCGTFSDWRLCEFALNPILQHPHNAVTDLVLLCTNFLDQEAKALSEALESPNVKVRAFKLDGTHLTFDEAMCLLAVLEGLQSLERLDWSVRTVRCRLQPGATNHPLSKENSLTLASHLALLLVRPGNILHSFQVRTEEWDVEHASLLANALINEHCQVEELHCVLGANQKDANLVIADAIFHSHNHIKALHMNIFEGRTAEILETRLRGSACKLESLAIPFCGQRTAIMIANILEVPNSSRLRVLKLGRQPLAVFDAFTKSIRSHHNGLRLLHLHDDDSLDERTRRDFYCALRISNVTEFTDVLHGPRYPFTVAFNDSFFLVLYALLSIKHIPRLGRVAWIRLLPLQDFILRIADTLGWPLDDLRAPFSPPAPIEEVEEW